MTAHAAPGTGGSRPGPTDPAPPDAARPDPTDPVDPADRPDPTDRAHGGRPRVVLAVVGAVLVVVGIVLLGVGFGEWGPLRYGDAGTYSWDAGHPTGRLAVAVLIGVVALALAAATATRSRRIPSVARVGVGALVIVAGVVVALWLARPLAHLAWPTHAGVAAVTGAAVVAWAALVLLGGRFLADRVDHPGQVVTVVAVVAVVGVGAACVPLLTADVAPSVQTAAAAPTSTPTGKLSTSPAWSTTDRVWGAGAQAVVTAHAEGGSCVVRGLDPSSGAPRWRWSVPTGRCDDLPTAAQQRLLTAGYVAIPAVDREYVLDAATGRLLWTHPLTEDIDDNSLADHTVAASSTLVVTLAFDRSVSGMVFRLIDPRTGRTFRSLPEQDVCGDAGTSNIYSRYLAGARTAALFVTCDDITNRLAIVPTTGDVDVRTLDERAGVALDGDTLVVAERTGETVTVRGLALDDGAAPRWTSTLTPSDLTFSAGFLADLTPGRVLVRLNRAGTTGATEVDTATGALSAYDGPTDIADAAGCSTTTCWFVRNPRTGLVSLDGQQLPFDAEGTAAIGPNVVLVESGGRTDVYA